MPSEAHSWSSLICCIPTIALSGNSLTAPRTGRRRMWDIDLVDGTVIEVAGTALQVLHTPGHAPGAVCLYAEDLGCVFTGDTLFNGGPGATGRSFSDRPTLEASIRAKLFSLPDDTVVRTGQARTPPSAPSGRAEYRAEEIGSGPLTGCDVAHYRH
jgi:glyoxylase-like metal-dependent hydrolase (beta-lactamase superfamily II)